MKLTKTSKLIERISNGFEIGIAVLLLLVIVIKIVEFALNLSGYNVAIFNMPFEGILSMSLGFVIGVEFVKMLCKRTSEAVVDVLLFTIARQMVVYHESMWDILIGVIVIAGMIATKKYLIDKKPGKIFEKEEGNPL
jgi:hypothetical protein